MTKKSKSDWPTSRGGLSNDDKIFIASNVGKISNEDIAKHVKKTLKTVVDQIAKLPRISELDGMTDAIARLHASPIWKQTKKFLFTEELTYFEQQWVALSDQFSASGIWAADEMMIKDLIVEEIMGNRALKEKKICQEQSIKLDRRIKKEYEKDIKDRDVSLVTWEVEYRALLVAIRNFGRDYLNYQQRKDDKFAQLKATREQRFKQAEQSSRDFYQMIRELNTPKMRRFFGKYMQKMKVASDLIGQDWSKVMRYSDGRYDKPFLSPEGELADDEKEKENE